jgi:glycosyltransferase involved in cell wall biosynthesis
MMAGSGIDGGLVVDLIWLGERTLPGSWPLGGVHPAGQSPRDLCRHFSLAAQASQPEAWLFWDASLGLPDPEAIRYALGQPGDLWHAGLRLGTSGLPGVIDFIAPIWMFNRDPDPDIEATSWRLSLGACLARRQVVEQMGFIRPEFTMLEAAALEWGHRCIRQGVITRHLPDLLPTQELGKPAELPFEDELRFALYRFGRRWMQWALLRAVLSGYTSLDEAIRAWWKLRQAPLAPILRPFERSFEAGLDTVKTGKRATNSVSVLIPTLERYPYLRTLLGQMRRQTRLPTEIIVVDQTQPERRQPGLREEFSDLPLRWIYRDQPGQCSSRNAGLQIARGEVILFLDDDDEAPEDLIETLLAAMQRYQAQAVSGVANESGASSLPQAFTFPRLSDVFPTNNTLVRREALTHSGLFDLAYEHGARADGDLGMRVYLSGALMVLEPAASVLHHHAPSGGLRAHQARVVTYSSSRSRLTHRRLASPTEIYLAHRHFSQRQVREWRWLNLLGTFSLHGSLGQSIAKAAISFFLLPDSLLKLRRNNRKAVELLGRFPQIPELVILVR